MTVVGRPKKTASVDRFICNVFLRHIMFTEVINFKNGPLLGPPYRLYARNYSSATYRRRTNCVSAVM